MTKMTITPKPDEIPVHIAFVLDRSGSMDSIRDDVIGGFNAFIDEQQTKPGKCRMTLVQFDSQDPFEIVHDGIKLAGVPKLTSKTFIPRASTPLLDAEGRTIARIKHRQAQRAKAGKPVEAVLFVTYTDGLENASTEWTWQSLSEEKKRLADDDGWVFMYLGAGHDAYDQSARAGTHAANTSAFDLDAAGVARSFSATSGVLTAMRAAARTGNRRKLSTYADDAYAAAGVAKPEDPTTA